MPFYVLKGKRYVFMKLKKWLLGLVAFAAMVVLCVVCTGAETYGDLEYSVLGDGTVEITDYNGSAEKVDIPAEIDGKSVTSIGGYAFSDCESIINITIPSSVTKIGWYTFNNCLKLTSIKIPNNVTEIGGYAFSNCSKLTSITMPNNVTEIGWYAFKNCKSLTSIKIPSSVISIGDPAFYGCSSLISINVTADNANYTSVNGVLFDKKKSELICYPTGKTDKSYIVPDGVTMINNEAFYNNKFLINITLPDSLVSIGYRAFSYCSSLKSVIIPDGVTEIVSATFSGCSSLQSVQIPNSVKCIGHSAFYECTSLKSITIPDSVTEITGGDSSYRTYGAFGMCTSLESVKLSENLERIDSRTFNGCTALKNITIPGSVKSIGVYAFNGTAIINNQTGVFKYVDKWLIYAFGDFNENGDGTYIDVVIPSDTNGIAENALGIANYYINNLIIPANVSSVGDIIEKYTYDDFNQSYYINNLIFENGVTNIESRAFNRNSQIKNIVLPKSLESIGSSAFNDCKSLQNIEINGGTIIGQSAFSGCTELKEIILPNCTKVIENNAFSRCSSLKSVTLSNSVTSIGDLAFANCTSLASITIPDSVKSINYWAFEGCTSLKSINIPDSVTDIGQYAFGYNYDYGYKKIDNFKIYCYSGTAGEQYAKDNSLDYELLDNHTHNFGTWKITKDPAYTTSGTKSRICSICGKVETATIAKLTLSKVTDAKLGGRAADALRINWTKNANADGYIVEMYQGNKWVRVAKITNNSTTTFRKAGLKAGTAYKFRVRAYKMSGKTAVYGAYSATVAATTNPSVIKGAKLTGRAADALRINWTKNTSADGYIVEMYKGNKWVRVGKITNNSTTTFRKAGLKASTVYKFRVRAYKMSGKTALYGNYSATVTTRTNPSIVKGVKIAGKAKDALRVNWAKNASAQGYIVEMYKSGKWVRVAKITNGNTTTFRKAGLAKNTAYKFRVRAYHMSGKTALYGNYGSVSGKTAAK